ncbi:MAG: hypothetical protein ACLP22_20775 [Solirubrobacteraceae bacterium]
MRESGDHPQPRIRAAGLRPMAAVEMPVEPGDLEMAAAIEVIFVLDLT